MKGLRLTRCYSVVTARLSRRVISRTSRRLMVLPTSSSPMHSSARKTLNWNLSRRLVPKMLNSNMKRSGRKLPKRTRRVTTRSRQRPRNTYSKVCADRQERKRSLKVRQKLTVKMVLTHKIVRSCQMINRRYFPLHHLAKKHSLYWHLRYCLHRPRISIRSMSLTR